MADVLWLSGEQWAVMEPFMPVDQPGSERNNDRQVISGIIHVLKSGCRWCDCPPEYGPSMTVHNRWSPRGFWKTMLNDATYVRGHRTAQGGNVWPALSASV